MPRPDVYPVSIHLTPAQAQRTAQKLLQALQAAQQTAQKKAAPSGAALCQAIKLILVSLCQTRCRCSGIARRCKMPRHRS